MSGGWFAVARGITGHHLFRGRPERLAVWLWLLDHAVWKDTPQDVHGRTVTVRRGSVCATERQIAAGAGVGRQVVRGMLSRLAAEGMIDHTTTQRRSIVTLCNFEKYQGFTPEGQPKSNPKVNPNANPNPTQQESTLSVAIRSGKRDRENEENPRATQAITQEQPIKEQVNNIPVGARPAGRPPDPVKLLFDVGVDLLTQAGHSERSARAILGRWRKTNGVEATLAALGRAQREGAVDPVAFVSGCFRQRASEPEVGETRRFPNGKLKLWNGKQDGWQVVDEGGDADHGRDTERGRDCGSDGDGDAAGDVPRMQSAPAQEIRPLPFGDICERRDRVVVSSLRLVGGQEL